MKKGDIVKIFDGSYSMGKYGNGKLKHISGTTLINEGYFEVMETGNFKRQTEQGLFSKDECNDIKLRSIKNKEFIVYTQKEFCNKQFNANIFNRIGLFLLKIGQ